MDLLSGRFGSQWVDTLSKSKLADKMNSNVCQKKVSICILNEQGGFGLKITIGASLVLFRIFKLSIRIENIVINLTQTKT